MSVALINDHVLMQAMPCWSDKIRWARKWQTNVVGGVTGIESRQSLRQVPRQTLSFLAFPRSQPAKSILVQQIRAALKSGMAVVPLWPRSDTLSASSSGTTLNVTLNLWPWVEDDLIFVGSEDDFEIATVASVGETTIALQAALGKTWPADTMVCPLFFGKPVVDELDLISPIMGKIKITVTEIVGSFRIIRVYPNCAYGDDFECYDLGEITDASRTSGTLINAGPVRENYTSTVARDDFEGYSLGAITSLTGGAGWDENGSIR